jgi:hypothetical protein
MKISTVVMVIVAVLALLYSGYLIGHSGPASSGAGAAQSKVAKAPVASQQLSPSSGAKPSSSVEEVKEAEVGANDGMVKIKLNSVFAPKPTEKQKSK